MNLLITGATGLLGKATVVHLLDDDRYQTLWLLIRATERETAQQRLEHLIDEVLDAAARPLARAKLRAVNGDLMDAGLGLKADDHALLQKSIHAVLHIGASTEFGAPLDLSRAINVEGTRRVLDFALGLHQAGRLRRFDYVSTAFVAGVKPGRVTESDVDRGQRFANSYEQSKFEAEMLVREYARQIPCTIHRPSIVVGDSTNGYTPHFKVLYWPIRLLSRAIIPVCFINKKVLLDVVPVDFVVRAMVTLMSRDETIGGCYHLTAGLGRSVAADRILKAAYQYAGVNRVPVYPLWLKGMMRVRPFRFLLPESFWEAAELAKPYEAYFRGSGVSFDSSRSDRVLAELGVAKPSWRDYEKVILSYCKLSAWGRRRREPTSHYYAHLRGSHS